MGYLDIILKELTGGVPNDSGLFERIKATFKNDIHACWELGEIVDTLTAGHPLTPDEIIERLWSRHAEPLREIKKVVAGDLESQVVKESLADSDDSSDDEQRFHNSDDEANLHEALEYCICNKESSGTMIACDNPMCPREWFHLHP